MAKYEGLIYDSSWPKQTGEVWIKPKRLHTQALDFIQTIPRQRLTGFARGIGLGLLSLGLTGFALTIYPIVTPEINYRLDQFTGKSAQAYRQAQIKTAYQDLKEKEHAQQFAQNMGIEDTQFSLYVPKINAKSTIIKNITPVDKESYNKALKQGVAHAAGTSLPGKQGATYLFAHSTDTSWNIARYNAVFYLLRKLNPEDKDEIYVFFEGKLHKYQVAEKRIVDAADISWLQNAPLGAERLILQTCWPPGTTWKRLVIVAYPEPSKYTNITN